MNTGIGEHQKPHARRRVTTISRYSLGTTSDVLPDLFIPFNSSVRSCSSAMAPSAGSDAKALWIGPYQVRKTSMKCAAELLV